MYDLISGMLQLILWSTQLIDHVVFKPSTKISQNSKSCFCSFTIKAIELQSLRQHVLYMCATRSTSLLGLKSTSGWYIFSQVYFVAKGSYLVFVASTGDDNSSCKLCAYFFFSFKINFLDSMFVERICSIFLKSIKPIQLMIAAELIPNRCSGILS